MDEPEQTPRPPSARTTRGKPRLRGGWLAWLFLYTRGLIVDQHLRRLTMFYVALADMLMVFVGALALFSKDWMPPREHVWGFAVYWLVVAWLTVLLALLALYDILLLRVQHRLVRRQLRQRMLGEEPPDADHEK